ncbi:unnamed protein product [Rhizoctonia solani]|uniref:Zn(2)-C6 fungal-type domain-containing protein n=1 Tax=Rhizoctonia solani TaxID=456999 RepID=A0A8H2WYW8_9AGAM|nr:unnamed protein product [Rhizoctonia solani]
MYTKRVSGPYPLSCITCRERRKKCDRTHPTCNRCKTGGFTCLGYASRDGRDVDRSRPASQDHANPSFTPSSAPPLDRNDDVRSIARPLPTASDTPSTSQVSLWRLESQLSQLSSRRLSSPQLLFSPSQPPIDTPFACASQRSPDDLNIYDEQAFTHDFPVNRFESSQAHISPNDAGLTWGHTGLSPWDTPTFDTSSTHHIDESHLDYAFYNNPDTSVVATEFITSQYMHAYSLMTIELVSHQESFVQSCVLTNITMSQGACWSLFIGAKIYQVAVFGYGRKSVEPYVRSLDQFGQRISTVNRNGMIVRELSGWLMAALELAELRFLVDPQSAYTTLRLAVPLFVQLAHKEPAIWRSKKSGPSLHRIILSSRVGLARFANADVVGSFILGLPQLISWDPVFIPELAHLPWDEWIPGLPSYFLLVLCTVNTWRERNPHARNLNEWIQYERNILNWCPRHVYRPDASDSWRTVGRLVIQEAFRHMTLIYLYMGMGNLRSSDPRVQASCSQISQLCGLVNANPGLAVNFFFASITVYARETKGIDLPYGIA